MATRLSFSSSGVVQFGAPAWEALPTSSQHQVICQLQDDLDPHAFLCNHLLSMSRSTGDSQQTAVQQGV